MKCEECGGTGKVQKWFYERTGFGKCEKVCGDVKCEWCNGTGEVEQTEQEYLQTCDTEQLAEFIVGVARDGADALKRCNGSFEPLNIYKHEFWVEWLKQTRTPIS